MVIGSLEEHCKIDMKIVKFVYFWFSYIVRNYKVYIYIYKV